MPTRVLKRGSRRSTPTVDPRTVRALGDRMLSVLGLDSAELSVLLTNDAEIRELNRVHRDKDRATDVLAFPLDEGPVNADPAGRMLGDVVISIDTAERQARGRRRDLLVEVRFLLAHGILHLVGYDHASPKEKREMTAMTHRLVKNSPLPAPAARIPRQNRPRAQRAR